MSQIKIPTFSQRIQTFRHLQTIKELTNAFKNSGLFCQFCHRVTDLTWVKIEVTYDKTSDEDTPPSTVRLCGRCKTTYETGWSYSKLIFNQTTKLPSLNAMLKQAHTKQTAYLKRPHPYY
jgi:hypothetical protein